MAGTEAERWRGGHCCLRIPLPFVTIARRRGSWETTRVPRLSERGREIAADLDQDSENLSEPSVEVVARGSKKVGEKQKQLEMIGNDSLDEYKKEWREISKQFEEAMRIMMNELSSLTEGNDTIE